MKEHLVEEDSMVMREHLVVEIKDVTEDGPISIKMISKLIMVTSKLKKVNDKNIKVKNDMNIGKLYEKSKKKR